MPTEGATEPAGSQVDPDVRLLGGGDCWWFPREVEDAPSLTVFKTRLDQAWGKPLPWKVSLPTVGGLELGDL